MADAFNRPRDPDIIYDVPEDDAAALTNFGDTVLADDPDYDPAAAGTPPVDENDHWRNLAAELPSLPLEALVADLAEGVKRDLASRATWKRILKEGIDRLGVDRDNTKDAPFPGAATVTDPTLLQSAIEFMSRGHKELFPEEGPVAVVDLAPAADPGDTGHMKEVEASVNWDLTMDRDYVEGFDKALLMSSLFGSAVRKRTWKDGKPSWETISPLDFVRPYNSATIASAPRKTHILKLYDHEVEANVNDNGWLKLDLTPSDERMNDEARVDNEIEAKVNAVVGVESGHDGENKDDRYVVHESHVFLDVEGTGRAPYIVTYDSVSHNPFAVHRNWDPTDPRKRPRDFFLQYDYLPWFGPYGLGLLHLVGGIAQASTGALRAMLDAARLATVPGGLYSRAANFSDADGGRMTYSPGEWIPVNIAGQSDPDLKKYFLPYPSNGVEPTLMTLLQFLVDRGKEFSSSVVQGMADSNQAQPVGTTMAMLEQQTVVFAMVYSRLHSTYAIELELTRQTYFEYLDEADLRQTHNGSVMVSRADFDGRYRFKPRADSKTFSQIQRITQAQAANQLVVQAQAAGVKVDMRQSFMNMAAALGLANVEKLFPQDKPPVAPPPADPSSEFAAILGGKPAAAAPGQNHQAHIRHHMARAGDPLYQPMLQKTMPALEALISDHAAQQAQEEIQQAAAPPPPPVAAAPAPFGQPGQPPQGQPPQGQPPQGLPPAPPPGSAFAPVPAPAAPPQGAPGQPPAAPPPDPQIAWAKAEAAAGAAEMIAARRKADPAFGGQGAYAGAADQYKQHLDAQKLDLERQKIGGTLALQHQKVFGDQQIKREQIGLDHDKHLHSMQVQREGIGVGHETALQGFAHQAGQQSGAQDAAAQVAELQQAHQAAMERMQHGHAAALQSLRQNHAAALQQDQQGADADLAARAPDPAGMG